MLKIESFKLTLQKVDYILAFKNANKLSSSEENDKLFMQRFSYHNLRSFRAIENKIVKLNYIGNCIFFRILKVVLP